MTDAAARETLIWADVDTGTDDALALLYLACTPHARLLGVSAVAGNVSVELAAANSAAVLALAGAGQVPVHLGARSPLLGPHRTAPFHGDDGLGGIAVPASSAAISAIPALDALRDAALSHPGQLTLLALGPLTTVALFVAAHPDAAAALRGVIAMGGARTVGNATALAEFNVWADPEAAQIVIESGVPLTFYPLEVFDQVAVDPPVVAEFAASERHELRMAAGLLAHISAGDHVTIGDAGAAVIAVHPELVGVDTVLMEVELSGSRSRGNLIIDERSRPGEDGHHGIPGIRDRAGIVVDADHAGIEREFLAALRG